jgi:hypothetical protein
MVLRSFDSTLVPDAGYRDDTLFSDAAQTDFFRMLVRLLHPPYEFIAKDIFPCVLRLAETKSMFLLIVCYQ